MPEVSPSGGDPEAPESDAAAVEPGPSSLSDALATPDSDAAEAYHRRARLAEDRLQEVLGAYRRLKQENEGFRERITRNVERRFAEQREMLVLRFIEILDNLDRALEASERSYATEPLIEGLIMVRTQLLQTLRDEGLERIPVLGLPFDPETSEAVETRVVEDADHHHLVVAEQMRGYRFDGKLVRAARVVVGEYTEAEPEAAASAASSAESAPAPPDDAEPEEAESTLEEIVDRVQAQEALFPGAFDEDDEEDRSS